MKIEELIKNRVSQKQYNDKDVDIEMIKKMLNIAVYAPNHKMREPWGFVLLNQNGKLVFKKRYEESLKPEVKELVDKTLEKIYKAPLILIVTMYKNKDIDEEIEDIQANAAMIQNFMLLSEDCGLSTHWKTPDFMKTDKFKDALGLEIDEIVTGILMVGYTDDKNKPKNRTNIEEFLRIY
ncbi:MAG: nitroreductase [Acholeplasmataceae bacterium]